MAEKLPRLDQFTDFPLAYSEDFTEINRTGCEEFVAKHPEFHKSDWNSLTLMTWCNEHGVPFTIRNLEVAFHAQSEAGLIQKQSAPGDGPVSHAVVIRRRGPRGATVPVEGGLADAEPTEGEASFLQKVADDPKLSDHQRKARDEKLRRAAVASRVAGSKLRPGEDPQISI